MVRLGLAFALFASGNGVLAAVAAPQGESRDVAGAECEYIPNTGHKTNDNSLGRCIPYLVERYQRPDAPWINGEYCRGMIFKSEGKHWNDPDHCINACVPCLEEAMERSSVYARCTKKETLAYCGMGYRPAKETEMPEETERERQHLQVADLD